MGKLTETDVLEADLSDWRLLSRELHARFLTGSFAAGAEFVAAITEVAEAANHHPDITLTYPWVDVALMSHDVSAITERDVALAREISRIADQREIEADPAVAVEVELALDCADHAAIGAFWAAVLGGSEEAFDGEYVTDPQGRLPRLWLQQAEAGPEPAQRFHLDLWVPVGSLDERIAAARAAGGRLVDDSHSPSFVVLADPEGNKVCLCTRLGRD